MICSILLPTRARPEKLRKCIESFFANGEFGEFEIQIATDDDDPTSRDAVIELADRFKFISALESPRGNGWHDLHLRYTELAQRAHGDWVWMMNDDCEISGNWTEALKIISPHNMFPLNDVAHPEFYRLGSSTYRHDATGGFPIVPNNFWKRFGHETIGDPPDKWLNDLTRDHGIEVKFLEGITISHQREIDEILPQSRY